MPSRSVFDAHRLSIIIISFGFIWVVIPLIVSAVSIPVSPSTDGANTHTFGVFLVGVMCMFFTTSVPRLSDEMWRLPKPTIRTVSDLFRAGM